ncbi:TPA: DUF262 domain-containing protein [Pseudomonas aeruginosa]|uniref:DUF262 domain-containing protein n=1 Tax=Pseudomonas aeruginosa TaxID=287 RepID=UPI0009364BC8|nr:DUF262 domain-containing protein [Pseudomonas aeruginosa]EIU5250882.1 DUF262 domain-containing protein [Pseudomonas aeruginosa]MBG6347440.1 DUF262 domain-containing protein [Pseudomonas aeruginosa]MBG6546195.1 DUF262 domain-containing protein [Pseudomonas aeruginosa]MBH3501090.1 DUF262 domain-containing protein [Pseudomonas aeruginosa]MBH4420174.1 DUF262 domain-containing protein [Pseudomonas aeruginosa]
MRPDKKTVTELFNDRQQYLIPLFQRGYVWSLNEQVQPLWEDLIDRLEAIVQHRADAQAVGAGKLRPLRRHFLGTVVIGSLKGGSSDAVGNRDVIDGQQRITTLQILLLAFRDLVAPLGDDALSYDLKPLTQNIGKYRQASDTLKVLPTNVGRDVMQALAELGSVEKICERFPAKVGRQHQERPAMVRAYLFFHAMVACHLRGLRYDDPLPGAAADDDTRVVDVVMNSIDSDNQLKLPGAELPLDAERGHTLLAALREGFQIMSLELEDEDDPQIIFETLNARGAPLLPSDLIRNFIFLHATRNGEDVDELYRQGWQHFDETVDTSNGKGAKFWKQQERQGRLKNSRLDLLLYHYVGMRKCEDLKVAHVFNEFKDWWQDEPRDTQQELARISHLAGYFQTFLMPGQASRFDLFCRRLKLLDVSTVTPLVLYLLEHHKPDSAEFLQAIGDLESYLVRRFICGYTTKSYNRTFLNRLLAEMVREQKTDAATLREKLLSLQGDSQCWPDDETFARDWCHRRLYQGRNTGKVRAVLEALELSMRGSKQESLVLPDGLTVEHVLPQQWQTHWPLAEATPENQERRGRLLHSIGNLTLVTQAFNSALSNEPFAVKRQEIVTTSLLMLNTHFQRYDDNDAWDEDEIVSRADSLFAYALKIWPLPKTH